MMNTMMDTMPAMSWAMGAVWLFIIALLVLGAAALLKYLFFSK